MVKVAVIAGDGIGPEVTREAMRVFQAAADLENFQFESEEFPFGAEHFLKTDELIPDGEFERLKSFDAIYLGAIGDPRCAPGVLERGIVGRLRWDMDMYVNLRPIKLYAEHICPIKDKTPQDIDILVVRENTEGAYLGLGGFFRKGTADEIASMECLYTRKGVERIIRYAFECAKQRPRRKLTLVDKVNAIPAHDLWQRTFKEVATEYPEVETDTAYVDAACMWLVKHPEWFDTIVTTNLFGDIVTDLGAQLVGGMGLASSANLHPGKVSLFEPIHGSAPKHAGKNTANPLAAILGCGPNG